MELETLKLILETIQNTSGDAKQVFMLFFGYNALGMVLKYVVGGAGIFAGYKISAKVVRAFRASTFASSLRELVCPKRNYGYFDNSERQLIWEACSEGVRALNENKDNKNR